jgi:hypothetical protein
MPSRVNVTTENGGFVMRFVFCIVIAALLPASALAAKDPMSFSSAQAAAARGDQQAAAALSTTTNRDACLSGCASRGHPKDQCVSACRPGLCHPGAEQPYCVSK